MDAIGRMEEPLLAAMAAAVPPGAWPAPHAAVLLGVSGGADSVALAFLMQAAARRWGRAWRLHLVHVNHCLRGEASDADAAFVEDLAALQQWDVTIVTRPARGSGSGLGVEEHARNQRYAVFADLLEAHQLDVVATAHHADDNAETVLHRLLRGTGLHGLAGIPAVRNLTPVRSAPSQPCTPGDPQTAAGQARRLIRPLLRLRRTELAAYLRAAGIAYREDASNAELGYTRNRIRHELIPHLERVYNPGARESLLRISEQARWLEEALAPIIDAKFQECAAAIGPDQVTLSCRRLLAEPPYFRGELVRRAAAAVATGHKHLAYGHYMAVLELAARSDSGKRLELAGGVLVEKYRDDLVFGRRPADDPKTIPGPAPGI